MATATELLAMGSALISATVIDGSRMVTYTQDGYSVVIPVGIADGAVLKVQDREGVRIERSARDYLIAGKDLVLNGLRVEPKRGAKIVDSNEEDGLAHTYELLSLPNGEKPWYWDAPRLILTVHTKHVGAA